MNRAEFRKRIRTSLANPTLQIALDANAERRVNGRINALASLPNWQQKRQQAHAIRAEVIEHLNEYLEQFITKATENGIVIHRVMDAAQAIKTIVEIVKHSPHRRNEEALIAKSKSMVTEEINLNRALEAEGPLTGSGQRMRVVETDLGEYIVQLRGEKPAHIITPAVHLRRTMWGSFFMKSLVFLIPKIFLRSRTPPAKC